MIKQKRGSAWIWIIIILILLVVVGIGLYFLLTGDSSSIVGGNSIPSPPPLPS
jgi:flagellar basal body-associated protein FliL